MTPSPPSGYSLDQAPPQSQNQPTPTPPSGYTLDPSGIGPQFPKAAPGTSPTGLPDITNEQMLRYLPAVGATAATLLQPELAPVTGGWLAGTLAGGAAAAIGGAAGQATKEGIQYASKDPNAPQSFGQAAGDVAKEGLAQGAMEVGGRAVAWPIEKIASKFLSPTALYGRELKASTALDPKVADRQIATGLREEIPISQEGYAQLGDRVDDISSQMESMVKNSPQAQIALVNPEDIANRIDSLTSNSPWSKQALNADDIATLKSAKQQYLQKHGAVFDQSGNMISPPNLMTPTETLEEKEATYQVNRQKYQAAQRGGATVGAAQDAGEKALARGGKEELIALYPELEALGQRDGSLIDLENSMRQFIGRERNRTSSGLKNAVILGGGSLAGMAAGSPEAGLGAGLMGVALNSLDDPAVKSALAIALARAGRNPFIGAGAKYLKPSVTVPLAIRWGREIAGGQQPQPQPPGGGQ